MGSQFSAEQFYDTCRQSSLYAYFFLYGLSTILAVIAIDIMRRSQGWHNFALILLLLNILLYSIGVSAYYYLQLKQQKYGNFLYGFSLTTENFCHWIITFTYIKTSLETRMLLNKDTYLKSADEMVFVPKFRCYLTTANISASILIVSIGALYYMAFFYDSLKLQQIADYATLVLQFLCSVAWAWTLNKLYRDIAHS